MTTLVIYGMHSAYDRTTKRTDLKLGKFEVELHDDETWRAPLGFNVTEIKVKL